MSRGGKREGAGRKHRAGEPTEDTRVTVRYTAAELAVLDERRGDLPRAEYVRRRTVG